MWSNSQLNLHLQERGTSQETKCQHVPFLPLITPPLPLSPHFTVAFVALTLFRPRPHNSLNTLFRRVKRPSQRLKRSQIDAVTSAQGEFAYGNLCKGRVGVGVVGSQAALLESRAADKPPLTDAHGRPEGTSAAESKGTWRVRRWSS